MTITILGASGKTGRLLVEQALAAGEDVIAFVRDPAKLSIDNPHLRLVQGDAADPAALEQAISGTDAVISVLGQAPGSPRYLLTTSARNIIATMRQTGVRRLIFMTGAGVKQHQDPLSFGSVVMIPLMRLLTPQVLADAENAVALIVGSGLDWTIVRAPRLGDTPYTGKYQAGYIKAGFKPISRADVAEFLLRQVTDRSFIQEAPILYS